MSNMAYRIVGWMRYEVMSNGGKAAEDATIDNLRVKPLEYIRSTVYGHSLSPSYAEINRKAAEYDIEGLDLAVFGLFQKLLEIAGNQKREFRGWILDHHQRAIDADKIRKLLQVKSTKVVQIGLEILCDPDIGWLEFCEFTEIHKKNINLQNRLGTSRQGLYNLGDKDYIALKETEENININIKEKETEIENQSDIKTPDSVSLKILDNNTSVSDSDSKMTMESFKLKLCEILPPQTDSDYTTYRNIAFHICREILARRLPDNFYIAVLKAAEGAKATNAKCIGKKIAIWVSWCKENTGFRKTVERMVSV